MITVLDSGYVRTWVPDTTACMDFAFVHIFVFELFTLGTISNEQTSFLLPDYLTYDSKWVEDVIVGI